jgi:uncharacterized protein (TIGR00255 family)
MIQSMTGFGSAEHGAFRIEIRSVNHRFMDISMKLPPGLGRFETPFRNMMKGQFTRGRFDISVLLTGECNVKVRVNKGLARELFNALTSLKDDLSLHGTIGIDTFSGFREIFTSEETAHDTESLNLAFEAALSALKEMRLREGESIRRDMLARLEAVAAMNKRVMSFSTEAAKLCKEKYVCRLKELFGEVCCDEQRILQEAAMMAEKMDTSEETLRIDSHLAQLRDILFSGDTVGRKIEFLLQEINREINTTASKSADYVISTIVVEIKMELEKMREQAQNIQ